jgi:hypothetical protein
VSGRGRKEIMADFDHTADLRLLLAAIANSPIKLTPAPAPARDFADWCEQQKPAEIDTVILCWLHSHSAQLPTH